MKDLKTGKGKNRLDLLPWEALERIGEVLTYGANKYNLDGWKTGGSTKYRYEAALLRHFSKYKLGEDLDNESGISHLAHMATNALFLLYFREIKNRRKP